MGAFANRRKLWLYRMERQCGVAPLDFRMARYIEAYSIKSRDELIEALQTKLLITIGEGTMNKLKALVGLPVKLRKPSWKSEAQRLYKLLEQHGIEYIKENQKEPNP